MDNLTKDNSPKLLKKNYHFDLPKGLIAKYPPKNRQDSRMLVVSKSTGTIIDSKFNNLKNFIPQNTKMVLNNTKVIPSRFFTDKENYEVLKVEEISDLKWKCLCKPAKRFKLDRIFKINGIEVLVKEKFLEGMITLELSKKIPDDCGNLALPPYMQRDAKNLDQDRYQTIFAEHKGSVAAPTAGLHFTKEILDSIDHTFVTLNVGVGTFRPVKEDNILNHKMHEEKYEISNKAANEINNSKNLLSVGTTVVRTLEDNYDRFSKIKPGKFSTNIFIYPGYKFKSTDMILTNFHLPESTLLMLVSAFLGKDLTLESYHKAINLNYSFYSYGDCMLIIE